MSRQLCHSFHSLFNIPRRLIDEHRIDSHDEFCRPSQVKILDKVPYGARPAVVAAFVEGVNAVQIAKRTGDEERLIGAWVVILRLFHPVVLNDKCGGGRSGAKKVLGKLKDWDEGDYAGSYMRAREQSMTLKQKVEWAVGDVTGGVYKVLKQCVKFMTQARISRAMQRLEAPAVCAGTTQVADELEVLHPEEFVPAGCVRRTRLKEAIMEHRCIDRSAHALSSTRREQE